MLCKAENRDPEHCLLEGRRVTRCAADLYVSPGLSILLNMNDHYQSISKLRDNCLKEFDTHWDCLEKNNHVCFYLLPSELYMSVLTEMQEYYRCRKVERTLNKCVFDKLVRSSSSHGSLSC